jgi:hypothetical protein
VLTSGGLVQLGRRTGHPIRLYTALDGLPHPPPTDLLGVDGQLWMAGEGGLVRLDPGTGQFTVVDEHPVTRLEHQSDRGALWAFGGERATCVELATGKAQSWPFEGARAIHPVGRELWMAECRGPGRVEVRFLDPSQDRAPETAWLPASYLAPTDVALCPAAGRLWAAFTKGTNTLHAGLVAVERATAEVRVHDARSGLPGDYPRMLQAHGDDLWVACSAEYYPNGWWQRYFGGGLARLNAETQASEQHLSVSGSQRGEPTAMKTIDGDLWVATQGYDETREMVVGFGMGTFKHQAPVVKHLALCRWQPRSETWEVHRFAAEHDYAAIIDFHVTSTDFWLLIYRTDLENLRGLLRAPEEGGVWLASCPRNGSDLQWHFQVTKYGPSHTWPRPVKGVYVIDDTIWVCEEALSKRFDPATRTWQDVQWPVPLPVTGIRAATAQRGVVWLGTERGDVLRLDATARQFSLQAQVQTFPPDQSPDRELVAPVNCLAVSRRGTLWVACGTGDEPPATRLPPGVSAPPVWTAPSSLLRLADEAATVPHAAPWSWALRGQPGDGRLVPPDEAQELKRSFTGFNVNAFGWRLGMYPGEPGLACVLPEEDRAWVGTLGDGLYCLADDEWERLGPVVQQRPLKRDEGLYPECLPDGLILALARTDSALCVATYGGLYRYEPRTGVWRSTGPPGFVPSVRRGKEGFDEYGSASRLAGTSFLVELRGELWMPGRITEHAGDRPATGNAGASWRDSFQALGGRSEAADPGMYPTRVARRNPEAQLYRLRASADHVECVPVEAVPECAVAHRGYLWVGTEKGLLRLDPRTGDRAWLTEAQGLPDNKVVALAADRDGLWIACREAVMRITPDEFDRRASQKGPEGT